MWDDFYLPSAGTVVKLAHQVEAASKIDPDFEEEVRSKEAAWRE